MPDNWKFSGRRDDVQVISPTQAIAIIRVGVITLPDEIYFEVVIPKVNYTSADFAAAYIQPFAEGVIGVSNRPDVAGLEYEESINGSGLQAFSMAITVQYISTNPFQFGPFTEVVTAPVQAFGDRSTLASEVFPKIDAAYADLQKLANE